MPASKKQIKANKENAKKSTGPKTKEGKLASSQNATTYGLFSNKLVIDSKYHKEDKVAYDMLVESLRWELDPQSKFQDCLVLKIANCLWRTQRAAIAETARINKQLDNLDDNMHTEQIIQSLKPDNGEEITPLDFSGPESKEFSNLVSINSIPDKTFASRILYYEMRIDRQLSRAYDQLQKLKRLGELDNTSRDQNTSIPNNEPNPP